MHISKIRIKNFKCFEDVEVTFDPNFNLIIGENNSGKSTIFEALRLWQLSIQQFYNKRTGKIGDGSKNMGFLKRYQFDPIDINDLSFLRIEDMNNILKNKFKEEDEDEESSNTEKNTFTIEVTFSNIEGDNSSIPLIFRPSNRNTLRCKIQLNDESKEKREESLREISHSLSKVMNLANNATFINRVRLAYIPPKFTLPSKEVLLSDNNAVIVEKLISGESHLVIRNILHHWCEFDYQKKTKQKADETIQNAKDSVKELIKNQKRFQENFEKVVKPYIEKVFDVELKKKRNPKSPFLDNVEEGIFKIVKQRFNFTSINDPISDHWLQIKDKNTSTEISQLGSGTINILNILSVLYFNEQSINQGNATKCNILLLDEPDSHLQFNLQNELFNYLNNEAELSNKQIFIITHNSSLISQFDKLLFINQLDKITPIKIKHYLDNYLQSIDEKHYHVIKELNEAKDKLKTIEAKIENDNRTYIVFEGVTDQKIFKIAYEKIRGTPFPYEIIDNVSSASTISTLLNGSKRKLGNLIGIYDNDHEGRTQFNHLNKEEFKTNNNYKISENKMGVLLPVPHFRTLPFYKKHLSIEYLFSNEDLLQMLGYENFHPEEGENYPKIKPEEDKHAYVIKGKLKSLISDECVNLPVESFTSFKEIFEAIDLFSPL